MPITKAMEKYNTYFVKLLRTALNQDHLSRFTAYPSVARISDIVAAAGLRPEFVPPEYLRLHHSRWVRLLSRIPLPGLAAPFCRFTQLALLVHQD